MLRRILTLYRQTQWLFNNLTGVAAVAIARRPGPNSSEVSCAAHQGIDMAQQNESALLNKTIMT
jgi:hypothetical protein